MPNHSGQRKRAGEALAIETMSSFDHGVENRETDGEDTEIWFNLNMRELKEDKSWLTSVNANANILGGNQQMCEKRAAILLL